MKKVLVCPLNWGLGHASRVIPVIYELINQGYEVYIGADGDVLDLLKKEFPTLKHIVFPSFNVCYGSRISLALRIIIQIPKIIAGILREHNSLKRIISSYSIDIVISDNRFGLWNKKIFSVFITHQIFIKLPPSLSFLTSVITKINRKIILKYDQCWIPDFKDSEISLSGELSHNDNIPGNARYIGLLSRFTKYNKVSISSGDYLYDLLVIVSGPEPQRSIFERLLTDKIKNSGYRAFILQGKPQEKSSANIYPRITVSPHLPPPELINVISKSKYIICRSGYSTIMDLIVLKRTAILIPTPGQSEQEYLARHLSGFFIYADQNNIDLKKCISELEKFTSSRHQKNMQKNPIVINPSKNPE